MTDDANPPHGYPTLHFAHANPAGPGYDDVPALLRRVADAIEKIPDIRVDDMTFMSYLRGDPPDMFMTVYFHIADEDEKEAERAIAEDD
jgi:hypothetical protein